jgi:hypothetical protein
LLIRPDEVSEYNFTTVRAYCLAAERGKAGDQARPGRSPILFSNTDAGHRLQTKTAAGRQKPLVEAVDRSCTVIGRNRQVEGISGAQCGLVSTNKFTCKIEIICS